MLARYGLLRNGLAHRSLKDNAAASSTAYAYLHIIKDNAAASSTAYAYLHMITSHVRGSNRIYDNVQ